MVCTCVRSCVRAWCCVWRGWRWLTSFDLTFDVPTGTVGRQSLPRSQSAFDDIFQSAHERGRGVVALSLSNHFAITPRPSPPVVPFDRKGSQSPCWIPGFTYRYLVRFRFNQLAEWMRLALVGNWRFCFARSHREAASLWEAANQKRQFPTGAKCIHPDFETIFSA